MESKFIKRFCVITLLFIGLIAFITVLFDPFYHYHDALPGTKRVLEERNYPLPGSIDHFDYDSVQAGSSVMENNNDSWFDTLFDCKSMKIAKGSSTIAELNDFINRAYKSHSLKNIFFCIDHAMLTNNPVCDFTNQDFYYLYDKNPLNDYTYLLNKDILFKKIPLQLAYSFALDYDEGESYNWYKSKIFSKDALLPQYYPQDSFSEGRIDNESKDIIQANISTLENMVLQHPETNFYFYFAPASILFLDAKYRAGELPTYIYAQKEAVTRLCTYSNVKLYAFNTREDIILNLNNYMDSVHFSQEINYDLAVSMSNGDCLVSSDNIDEYLLNLENVIKDFSHKGILDYYPDAVID